MNQRTIKDDNQKIIANLLKTVVASASGIKSAETIFDEDENSKIEKLRNQINELKTSCLSFLED